MYIHMHEGARGVRADGVALKFGRNARRVDSSPLVAHLQQKEEAHVHRGTKLLRERAESR